MVAGFVFLKFRIITMPITVLCRLERESTGSWLDVPITLNGGMEFVDENLEGILSMVYPGWDIVSYCLMQKN